MRLKYYVLGLFAAASMLSCKVDKKEDAKPAEEPTAEAPKNLDSKVKVILDMVVPKNDVFQIFYNENGTRDYNGDLSLRVPVKGQEGAQQIVFPLKEESLPTTIRLDFGENSAQEKMTVNKITIQYYDKKLEISGPDFVKYFTPNENITVDKGTGVLNPKTVNDSYDPMAYPSDELIAALKPILTK